MATPTRPAPALPCWPLASMTYLHHDERLGHLLDRGGEEVGHVELDAAKVGEGREEPTVMTVTTTTPSRSAVPEWP